MCYTIRLHRYFQIIKREIGFFEAISLLSIKKYPGIVSMLFPKGVLSRSIDTALPQEFSIVAYQRDAEWRFFQIEISPRGMRLIRFTFNEGRLGVKKKRPPFFVRR